MHILFESSQLSTIIWTHFKKIQKKENPTYNIDMDFYKKENGFFFLFLLDAVPGLVDSACADVFIFVLSKNGSIYYSRVVNLRIVYGPNRDFVKMDFKHWGRLKGMAVGSQK